MARGSSKYALSLVETWPEETSVGTDLAGRGKSPQNQAQKASPSRKPARSPTAREAASPGNPTPKQWEGQAMPHQLVLTPWTTKERALGIKSIHLSLEQWKGVIHIHSYVPKTPL